VICILNCCYIKFEWWNIQNSRTVSRFRLLSVIASWSLVDIYIKKQSLYTPWRRLGERRYSFYSFSTSALDGGVWSASRPGRAFTPGERTPGTHCTGGWVGPRRGSNPDRPVVQFLVRHYTAWATPAPLVDIYRAQNINLQVPVYFLKAKQGYTVRKVEKD
jgi:hypothetical protein